MSARKRSEQNIFPSTIPSELSPIESRLWMHRFAAEASTHHSPFPAHCGRFVGCITRTLTSEVPFNESKMPCKLPCKHRIIQRREATHHKAKKESQLELERGYEVDDAAARASEIREQWKNANPISFSSEKPWDENGHIHIPGMVSVNALQKWMESTNVVDSHEGAVAEVGNVKIAVDTKSVMVACADLMSPIFLWNVPLLFCPVRWLSCKKRGKQHIHHVQIAVYANRLVAEATTTILRVVFAALDDNSYRLVRPLTQIPQACKPTFVSSEFPKVSFKRTDHSQSAPKSSRLKSDKKQGVVSPDSMLESSTRNDDTISAFSNQGFLKLMENTGCDTSQWPRLRSKLSKLRLKLLPHQVHAICWMWYMESIDVNSLIWETREFVDGGYYYYAPTLGQLRLDSPYKNTSGGLLCDEMGLGKTIMLVSLILCTLDDVKQEAQPAGPFRTHATLIVVPPALLEQWISEIQKCVGDALQIDVLEFKDRTVDWRYGLDSPDICLTSYTVLTKPSASHFCGIRWGRVVLDEMQEIRSSTNKVSKETKKLLGRRRWMLSGTPLFEGINDFKGELDFLNLEPFSAATEDGFFRIAIVNPWEAQKAIAIDMLKSVGQVMLRRSKSMTMASSGLSILDLKPMTVEFVPVVQSHAERALYYFLEMTVAKALENAKHGDQTNEDSKRQWVKKQQRSRRLFLTLLRDICTSAVLINGGAGVASQLKKVNQILIEQARSSTPMVTESCQMQVLSCDEGILYLAQAQEATRSGRDEVAMMQLGFGQGLARRDRATECAEHQRNEAEFALKVALKQKNAAVYSKAIALWHIALEKVTTGALCDEDMLSVSSRIKSTWISRRHQLYQDQEMGHESEDVCGWRPTRHALVDFFWGFPNSFQLTGVPDGCSTTEVATVISRCLEDDGETHSTGPQFVETLRPVNMYSSDSIRFGVVPLGESQSLGLVFKTRKDRARVIQAASLTNGIHFFPENNVACVQNSIEEAQREFDEAEAMYSVHPCKANRKRELAAKKELQRAKMGLSIVCKSDARETSMILHPRQALRSQTQTCYYKLLNRKLQVINDSNTMIAQASLEVQKHSGTTRRLASVASVDNQVRALSSFDTLQALSEGRFNDTQCAICLFHLGSNGHCSNGEQCKLCRDGESSSNRIVMTICGHAFCSSCFRSHATRGSVACPVCRKRIEGDNLVRIDPAKGPMEAADLKARRLRAKRIVEGLSQQLHENSTGQLEAETWEHLYHSIDLPAVAKTARDIRVSALPPDFLGHVKWATNMPILGSRETPLAEDSLSSKIRVLLRDLPTIERSVVFSSSQKTIAHLVHVFESKAIGHRVLMTGQDVEVSKRAVGEWQAGDGQEIPVPVLLVQAGAAASGLTLTTARKMFLMEPFTRYEEEQQAYARCHRYGQTRPVVCKCYYAPVSVESRLLEWRKRIGDSDETEGKNTCIIYKSKVDGESDEEDDDSVHNVSKEEEEATQTEFLLGLNDVEATNSQAVDPRPRG